MTYDPNKKDQSQQRPLDRSQQQQKQQQGQRPLDKNKGMPHDKDTGGTGGKF